MQGVKKNGDFHRELEGKVSSGFRGGLCTWEAEDKVVVTGALKPIIAFKVPSITGKYDARVHSTN